MIYEINRYRLVGGGGLDQDTRSTDEWQSERYGINLTLNEGGFDMR